MRAPPAASRPPAQTSPPLLLPTLLLLCALSMVAVARSPFFPRPFLYAFVLAAALRLAFGRGGGRLVPGRALMAVGLAAASISVAFLFHRLAQGSADSLMALMAVVSVFQGLCLFGRQTTFSAFLLILLSSVHAAGAAIETKDTAGLVFIFAYVLVLAWTLLLFERNVSLERETEGDGAVRRVRAACSEPVPTRALFGVVLTLLLLGFPIGIGLYVAAPRNLRLIGLPSRFEPEEGENVPLAEGTDMPEAFRSRGPTQGITGPGKGVPFGSVTEIKKDFTAWFEVREDGYDGVPRGVILRDNTQDYYTAEGMWRDTLSRNTRLHTYTDDDDGNHDGWVGLSNADDEKRGRTLRIELKWGGHRRLYLQPNEVRLQILRHGTAQSGYLVTESRNKTFEVSFPLLEGDQILERAVLPIEDDRRLEGRRSDSSISPSMSFLQIPEVCRGPLGLRARAVVGGETDPWKRARLIEAWLRSEAFTYTLSLPPLDPRNPIVDFIENTRAANCEGFAIALTLMLRTLGHPTRYVRGFWGGDPLTERGSVILRGHHYHAWTEMFLDGVGWVPLNPTPPDRRPADADTFTVAAGGRPAEAAEEVFSILGYDQEQWGRFWGRIGGGVRVALVDPLLFLFGSRSGYIGFPLVLLLLLLAARRRRTVRVRRQILASGSRLPRGPYGKALMLLARKGMRRRPTQTARAFARITGKRFPAAAGAFDTITTIHERERYGGGAPTEAHGVASKALHSLKDALRRKRETT